ncbi:MAG: hypothetical protein R3B70_17120 [Polyangiaceae bacterium]
MSAADAKAAVAREAELRALSGVLRASFSAALRGVSLRGLVASELPPLPPKRARVRVVSMGKAAPAMLRGALDRWPGRVERALAVTVGGAGGDELSAEGETAQVRGDAAAQVRGTRRRRCGDAAAQVWGRGGAGVGGRGGAGARGSASDPG